MSAGQEPWPQPMVTANAQLLMGYLLGGVDRADYNMVGWDPKAGVLHLQNRRNGNEYRVTVVQISGTE